MSTLFPAYDIAAVSRSSTVLPLQPLPPNRNTSVHTSTYTHPLSKCFAFCSSLSDGKFSALAPTPPARPHAFVDIRSVHTHYTCNSKRIGTLFLKLRSWYSQAPSPPRFELFVRIPSTAASGGMMWRQTLTLAIIDQKGPTGHGAPAIRSKMPAAQKIIPNSPTPIATDQGTQARHVHEHPTYVKPLNWPGLCSKFRAYVDEPFCSCSADPVHADISSSVFRHS